MFGFIIGLVVGIGVWERFGTKIKDWARQKTQR